MCGMQQWAIRRDSGNSRSPQRLPTSIRDNINDKGIVYSPNKYRETEGIKENRKNYWRSCGCAQLGGRKRRRIPSETRRGIHRTGTPSPYHGNLKRLVFGASIDIQGFEQRHYRGTRGRCGIVAGYGRTWRNRRAHYDLFENACR